MGKYFNSLLVGLMVMGCASTKQPAKKASIPEIFTDYQDFVGWEVLSEQADMTISKLREKYNRPMSLLPVVNDLSKLESFETFGIYASDIFLEYTQYNDSPKKEVLHIPMPGFDAQFDYKLDMEIDISQMISDDDGMKRLPCLDVIFEVSPLFSPSVKTKKVNVEGDSIPTALVKSVDRLPGETLIQRLNLIDLIPKYIKAEHLKDGHLSVSMQGSLSLNEYQDPDPESILDMAAYGSREIQRSEFTDAANTIKGEMQNPYEISKKIVEFIGNKIEYESKENFFKPFQALTAGKGDCDDYAEISKELHKAAGIPSKSRAGYVMSPDGEILGGHRWVEVLYPAADGFRWALQDPTWADDEIDDTEKYLIFNSKDPKADKHMPEMYVFPKLTGMIGIVELSSTWKRK